MEDLELVNKVLKGDIDSFEKIILKYEKMIFNFIYNIINEREASEDLTQEVFISAYNKLYTFNKKYKFSTWLYQIAKNKSIDYIRKRDKEKQISMENMEITPDRGESPGEIVEYKELKQSIENFIGTLDDKNKQILLLRYIYDKFTFNDIAEMVGMSQAAVKKRYYSIYEKYKKHTKSYEILRKE